MGPDGSSRLTAFRRSTESPKSFSQGTPTTFFMANEDELVKSQSSAAGSDSTFGVKSLEGRMSSVVDAKAKGQEEVRGDDEDYEGETARRRSTLKPTIKAGQQAHEMNQTASPITSVGSSPRKSRRSSPLSASHSLVSISQTSQDPGSSIPSSPKSHSSHSFRPSDEESMYEGGSQAIASSDEDEPEIASNLLDSAPQLIMPSIKMPSRRPFTERGKDIGRLKILIAGDSGLELLNVDP